MIKLCENCILVDIKDCKNCNINNDFINYNPANKITLAEILKRLIKAEIKIKKLESELRSKEPRKVVYGK